MEAKLGLTALWYNLVYSAWVAVLNVDAYAQTWAQPKQKMRNQCVSNIKIKISHKCEDMSGGSINFVDKWDHSPKF